MDTCMKRAAKRIAAGCVLAAGFGGCAVYAPPYAAYDPYYSGYAYPTYVAPPVSLNFGFYGDRHHGYYGGHGHGWRGHGSGWGRGRGGRH